MVPRSLGGPRRSRGAIAENRWPTERELEEASEQGYATLSPPNWRRTAMAVLGEVRDAVFLPFSVLVYAVNITSALGYLMLMNTPAYQQGASPEVYWKM